MGPMITNDTFPHLNPDTPMAFLPPDIAAHYTAATYVVAAVMAAWFMDVFLSIPDEVRIYSKGRFKLPDLVYFLSRVVSGGFFLTAFILSVAPLHDCSLVLRCAGWFSGFTTPMNSTLFLLRVCGVFHGSKMIIGFFLLLWLATFTSFVSVWHVKARAIGPTHYCIIESLGPLASLAFIVSVAYDTLVFLAITWRVVMDSPAQGWKARTSLFLTGEKMGHISRALLQTGQVYYFIAVTANIIATVVISLPSVPILLKPAIVTPASALQNAMACRVFRLLKLGSLRTGSDPFKSFGLPSHIVNMDLVTVQFDVPADAGNVT